MPAAPDPGVYPRLAVVALVREEGRRWLLVRNSYAPGLWAPVGGRALPGESLTQATEREVLEEVGLRVGAVGPCYAALLPHKGEPTLAVSLACRVKGRRPAASVSGEVLEWRWMTEDEWWRLAREGRSPWTPRDVRRGVRLAAALLEMDE